MGARGSRVRQVVNELRGEKVDVVQWREDPKQFIAEALGPAKVQEVRIDEGDKSAIVIVSDHQLSLAIGREGQNARLAAKLTGYRIDIRSETEDAGGLPEPAATQTPEEPVVESPISEVATSEAQEPELPAEAVSQEELDGAEDDSEAE